MRRDPQLMPILLPRYAELLQGVRRLRRERTRVQQQLNHYEVRLLLLSFLRPLPLPFLPPPGTAP